MSEQKIRSSAKKWVLLALLDKHGPLEIMQISAKVKQSYFSHKFPQGLSQLETVLKQLLKSKMIALSNNTYKITNKGAKTLGSADAASYRQFRREQYGVREAISSIREGREPGEMASLLLEISFRGLLKNIDNGRISRAKTVRTKPPVERIDPKDGKRMLLFNFKARPSTEKKRHKGYVKFLKEHPDELSATVEVGCDCLDYMYVWEVANNKIGASKIIYSNGEEPEIKNPKMIPGMCKHIIAMKGYLETR